jgi:DNA-binding response OmpR family regulator
MSAAAPVCFQNSPRAQWLASAFLSQTTSRMRWRRSVNNNFARHSCHCTIQNTSLRSKKGIYIDLGTLHGTEDDPGIKDIALTSDTDIATEESLNEWRGTRWVVLIDDEPSIRLAIGDYLHSMGYTSVTACDGPLSFLEMLLWTQGWSFLDESNPLHNECPPWLEDAYKTEEHPWRLPSIVISDIRMPGGVDGIQLLELLREQGPAPEEKKRRRQNNKKQKVIQTDEDEDEVDTPDTSILDGWIEFAALTPISTPVDNARNILDAIQYALEHCKTISSSQSATNYPEQIQDIPVILLTAKGMVSDRVKGYKAGADGYLPKPFRPEELLRMVDNLMRRQDRERSAKYTDALHNNSGSGSESDKVTYAEIKRISKELNEIKMILKEQLQGT